MFLLMSAATLFFHHIFNIFNIEKQLFEKYSINMMRSFMCYMISYEAYKNFNYIWIDKCLDNENILTKFKDYHNDFLSYFISILSKSANDLNRYFRVSGHKC